MSQVWDVVDLKFTFRRAFSHSNMLLWDELLQVANSLTLSHEKDALIWKYNSNGQYSVQTLYANVNCRGIFPIHTPAVWKLDVPPSSSHLSLVVS